MTDTRTFIKLIKSRGHWHTSILPLPADRWRLPDTDALSAVLWRCAVGLRIWPYPRIDPGQPYGKATGVIISQSISEGEHLEHWLFGSGGAFYHWSGLTSDWRDRSPAQPPPPDWQPGALLPVRDSLARLTELFELAARLAVTPAGDARVQVGATFPKLAQRTLYDEQEQRPLPVNAVRQAAERFRFQHEYDALALVADHRELAVEAARLLFERCGWQPPPSLLRGWQDELFAGAGQGVALPG